MYPITNTAIGGISESIDNSGCCIMLNLTFYCKGRLFFN
jgi:hypothetical protein